jgi:AcrR family transcriptional regulator
MPDTDAFPTPPRRGGRTPRTSRRAPRSLSREAILDAAMTVLDAEGLDAVTMRRVATELGTGPASLYAHVADKEEMVAALLDRVIGEVSLPTLDAGRWQEQVKELAREARAAFGRHRDIARATLGEVPTGENAMTVSERLVSILLAGGVSEQVAAFSVDILSLYFSSVAYEESIESFDKYLGEAYHLQLRDFFASLPPSRFPNLHAMAVALTSGEGDERFEFGLDLLVRGIASTVTGD